MVRRFCAGGELRRGASGISVLTKPGQGVSRAVAGELESCGTRSMGGEGAVAGDDESNNRRLS